MAKYIAIIKEVGRNSVLTSTLVCETKTKEELISFWGLDEDDVETYFLLEVINGEVFVL